MEISSYVIHKEDTKKIIYVVEKIFEDKVYISGLNYRIRRIVKPEDLILATEKQIEEENKQTEEYYLSVANITHRNNKSYLLGRVLHIDGDKKYLDKCLELYKAIGVYANGYETDEKSMALKVKDLLLALNPEYFAITGHDVYNNKGTKDLNNYTNTTNYIEAVKKQDKLKEEAT